MASMVTTQTIINNNVKDNQDNNNNYKSKIDYFLPSFLKYLYFYLSLRIYLISLIDGFIYWS